MKPRKIASLLAFSFLALSSTIVPMNPPKKEAPPKKMVKKVVKKVTHWRERFGDMLTGDQPIGNAQAQLTIPNDPFPFDSLPKDKQRDIIFYLGLYGATTSLNQAAEMISNLAQTNHFLNELINEPTFCLALIKSLARRFNCSDFHVSKTLKTERGKIQHNLQQQLYDLCIDKDKAYQRTNYTAEELEAIGFNHAIQLTQLIGQKVDPNYTYDPGSMPALVIAIYLSPQFALHLLDAPGIDPELASNEGTTPLMAAQEIQNEDLINRIKKEIKRKYSSVKK